jgi:hypothetical protein
MKYKFTVLDGETCWYLAEPARLRCGYACRVNPSPLWISFFSGVSSLDAL